MSGVSTTEEDDSEPSHTNVHNRTSEEHITIIDRHAAELKITASDNEKMPNNTNDHVTDLDQQQVIQEARFNQITTANQKQPHDLISEANGNYAQDVEHSKTKVRFAEDRISIKDEIRSRNKICIITKKTNEITNGGKRKFSLKSRMALLSASSNISEDEITESRSHSSISPEPKNTENTKELQSNANDQVTDCKQQRMEVQGNETTMTTTENQEQIQDSLSETVGQQDVVHLKTKVRIDKAGLHRSLSLKDEVRSRNNICIITNKPSETADDGKRKPSIKAKIAQLSGKKHS